MKTILLSGTYEATGAIVKPIVTTVVPNDAESSSISVVATADLSTVFPVSTVIRISSKDDTFYTGDIAPYVITFRSTAGIETRLTQSAGHILGSYLSANGAMSLTYSPVTGKTTLKSGTVEIPSEESYPSVSDINTLTFKASIGGVLANYGSATVVSTAKFTTKTEGTTRSTPSVSTVNLVANHQTKGISSVRTTLVLPAGTKITHNAPATAKVYISFDD